MHIGIDRLFPRHGYSKPLSKNSARFVPLSNFGMHFLRFPPGARIDRYGFSSRMGVEGEGGWVVPDDGWLRKAFFLGGIS